MKYNTKIKGIIGKFSATLFVAAFALMPISNISAATGIWEGNTDLTFSTATNWSTGDVPLDGDTINFNSTDTGTAYPAAASLTNTTGNAVADLNALGTTGSYDFTIDTLKAQDGAVFTSSDTVNNVVTITTLTAQGDITLDGVTATNITVLGGGTVTLKNQTTVPTTITDAGNIIVDGSGSITQANVTSWDQLASKTLTIKNGTNLTLTSNAVGTSRSIIVGASSTLTLTSGTTYSTPIIVAGGRIATTSGTATISTLTLSANSQYLIPGTDSTLIASSFDQSTFTFTEDFDNDGTFVPVTTTGEGAGTTDETEGTTDETPDAPTEGTVTGGGGADDGTPDVPNTAFALALANPLVVIIATLAIIGASIGIMRLRKQQ